MHTKRMPLRQHVQLLLAGQCATVGLPALTRITNVFRQCWVRPAMYVKGPYREPYVALGRTLYSFRKDVSGQDAHMLNTTDHTRWITQSSTQAPRMRY